MPKFVKHPNGNLYKLPINGQNRIAMVQGPQYVNKIMKVQRPDSYFYMVGSRGIPQNYADNETIVNNVSSRIAGSNASQWLPGYRKTFMFQGRDYAPSLSAGDQYNEVCHIITAHKFKLRYVPYTISSARLFVRAPVALWRNRVTYPTSVASRNTLPWRYSASVVKDLELKIANGGGALGAPSTFNVGMVVPFSTIANANLSNIADDGVMFQAQPYNMFNHAQFTSQQHQYAAFTTLNKESQNWQQINLNINFINNMIGRDYVWFYIGFVPINFLGGSNWWMNQYVGVNYSIQDLYLELTLNGGPFT